MIAALAAAALFYLLPLAAGASLLGRGGRRPALPDAWIAGTLALAAWLAAVNVAAGLFGWQAGTRLALLQAGAAALALPALLALARGGRGGLAVTDVPLTAAGLAAAAAAVAVWRADSPYPALLNWDMFEHLALSEQMLRGHVHLSLRSYSDTFTLDTYLPFYHALLSFPRALLAPDPAGFAWSLDTLHTFVAVGVTGWTARRVLGSRSAAAWAMVVAAFSFESHVAYTSVFHMPQTLTAVFFTAALGSIAGGATGTPALLRWAAFLVASHFFVGVLAGPLLIGFGLLARLEPARARRLAIAASAVAAGALAAALVARHAGGLVLDPFGTAESAHFTLGPADVWRLMRRAHGFASLLLLPLGALLLWRGPAPGPALAAATGVALAAALSPLPYVMKFATLFHFLGAMVMAAGLRLLASGAGIVGITAWLAAWLAIFGTGQKASFKREPHHGVHTLSSADERAAAAFLRERFPPETALLVGEPATQHILEGLSGVNTQGGTFASGRTRDLVDRLWPADAATAADAALQVRDRLAREAPSRVLIAVGGRFFAWQAAEPRHRRASHFNVWRPRDMAPADWEALAQWRASDRLRLLFRNDGVALFEVLPPTAEAPSATISSTRSPR